MQLAPMQKFPRYRNSRAYQGKNFHKNRDLIQSRYVHRPRSPIRMTHVRIRASAGGNIPRTSKTPLP
jgi:hypothetical protein